MDLAQLQPFYDSTLIEAGIQEFYCDPAGPVAALGAAYEQPPDGDDPNRGTWKPTKGVPFYTANQALFFQKGRPAVWIDDFSFSEIPEAQFLAADGVMRYSAWRGQIRLGLITLPNFKLHTALRAQNLALIPLMQASLKADGSGIDYTKGLNPYLEFHEIGQLAVQSVTPRISPGEGYYTSPIVINLTWSIRPALYPSA